MGPRCFASIRGLLRAHRGPGGYCRHSGNQGTTGRPARAHKIPQKISLRTRLSKPGEPREGSFSSPRVSSLGEGPLLDKVSSTPPAVLLRTQLKGSARLFASRSAFLVKQSLPPRQSAHGLCAMCRVTRVPTRDDDDAAVAVSMYKAVNKAEPSKADNEYCLFGDKGTVCSYAPRTTSPWVTSHLGKSQPTVQLVGAPFQLW